MENKTARPVRFLVTAALIAAAYCALTILLAPISYGAVQFRVSELLTVLPAFTPAAIPGLFVGCVLGNIPSPLGILDMAVGGGASLAAAWLSRKMPVWWLVPLPPVLVNGIVVGIELYYVYSAPLLASMISVAAGEAAVCFIGGIPLMAALSRVQKHLFPGTSRMPVVGRRVHARQG